MKIGKKYHCIKQHDIKDCGAACLATISKQYGLKIPISKIREVVGTDMNGTSAYGVVKLYIVSFTEIQLDIMEKCRQDELTILMRRVMMICACALAEKYGV